MVALAEPARRTAKLLAKYMKNFTYNETPDDTHNTIWFTALPSIFDFFDAHSGASAPTPSKATTAQ